MTALTPLCRPPDSTALQVTVPTAAVTAGPLRGSPASTGHPAPRSQSDHTSSTSDRSWLFALGGLPAVTHALPGWPPLPPPPRAGASAPAVPASGLHRPSGVQRHLPGEAVPPSRQACWSRKSRSRGCCPPPAACCPRLLRGADPGAPAGSRPPPRGCTYLAVVGACVPEPPAQAANAVQHQAPDQVLEVGGAVDHHFFTLQHLDFDRGQHGLYEESPVESLGKEGRREREAQRLACEKHSPRPRMLAKPAQVIGTRKETGDITTEPRDWEKRRGPAGIFGNVNVMDGETPGKTHLSKDD